MHASRDAKPRAALRVALLASVLIAAGVQPFPARATGDAPCVQRLRDPDALSSLPKGVTGGEASSHDRMGGNDDGFSGKSEFASVDGGKYVLLDLKGPGCVGAIGFTWLYYASPHASALGNLEVYLDGESTPAIDAPIGELFSGKYPPFTSPLTEDISGQTASVASYVPIPFRDGIRILLAGQGKAMFFYEIWHERYARDEAVSSFSWSDDYSDVAARWSSPGSDPWSEQNDPPLQTSGHAEVAPGETASLASLAGPGRIESLLLKTNRHDTDTIERLKLRAWWDGEHAPGIDAPVGLFFASAVGDAGAGPASTLTRSLLAGANADGDYYSYWPMPFAGSARLEIVNDSALPVVLDWSVAYRSGPAEGSSGNLRTQHGRGTTEAGKDWVIASVQDARGRYVGTVLRVRSATSNATLEGDERVYVDGALSPAYHGTGTEDYFHGAWYFAHGPFSHAIYGAPVLRSSGRYAADKTNVLMYRWHTVDAIPFERSLRFSIEHGHADDVEAEYETLGLYYASPGAGLRQTDEVDVGNAASEAAHGYTPEGPSAPHARREHYEGERDGGMAGEMLGTGSGKWAQEQYTSRIDPLGYTVVATTLSPPAHAPAAISDEAISDDGRLTASPLSFHIAVDPSNEGVRLRRRLDQGVAPQTADVYVDGALAGTWHSFEANPFLRWRDEDIELPAALTRAKSALEIRIAPHGAWTDYRYWVISRAG